VNPVSISSLKKLAKLLVARNELSMAYIYINKAIKLDEEENELWNLLSVYYMKNGDYAKYHECILKELEIQRHHCNSLLIDLIPKIMI
jgi:Flp pilus assembly protein TadD